MLFFGGGRKSGRVESSHRGGGEEGEVGGVWEGFDDEVEDE